MIPALRKITDHASALNIEDMTASIVSQLDPLKIYLFGSFADGTYTADSDYDFYIVVDDDSDLWDVTAQARRAVRNIKQRPVDIVAGTNTRFNKYGPSPDSLFIEGEVYRKGILLYDNNLAGASHE